MGELKKMRTEKKMTQQQVADLVGISLRSYKSYENDEPATYVGTEYIASEILKSKKGKLKMKKYSVTYHETYEENYEIEANSPKEAVEILLERIREGKEDGPENCSDSWADVTEL